MGSRGSAPVIRLLMDPGSLDEWGDRLIPLPEREAHHLRVRRARPGDPVELLDGEGAILRGRVDLENGEFRIRAEEAVTRCAPPLPLVLRVAAGDRDRFAWLVEKATELGVSRITPLETTRTRSVASRLQTHHLPALQQRAREAAKQCGAPWIPVLEPLTGVEDLAPADSGVRWLADPGGTPVTVTSVRGPVEILVGPEGGFTSEEVAFLCGTGALPVRFGGHTLRFETAAVAGAVLISTLRGGVTT